jgi:hypothetical protein
MVLNGGTTSVRDKNNVQDGNYELVPSVDMGVCIGWLRAYWNDEKLVSLHGIGLTHIPASHALLAQQETYMELTASRACGL